MCFLGLLKIANEKSRNNGGFLTHFIGWKENITLYFFDFNKIITLDFFDFWQIITLDNFIFYIFAAVNQEVVCITKVS